MTTRRYPRSMTEAFPADHHSGVVTHYRRPLAQRVADALFTVIIAVGAAATLFYGLSS